MNNYSPSAFWGKLRLPCLALVLGGTATALAAGLKTPLQPRPAIAPYSFPASIPLSSWQQLSHTSLPLPEDKKLTPIASQAYQYRRTDDLLTIEIRYLTATKGDVVQFTRWYKNIPDSVKTELHQQQDIGSYIFFTDRDTAHLSACIHPKGQVTATGSQYIQTKLLSNIDLRQFIGWLVGRDNLFDRRCLWSYFSLPLRLSLSPDEAHRILKQSSNLWYDWWKNHFPES